MIQNKKLVQGERLEGIGEALAPEMIRTTVIPRRTVCIANNKDTTAQTKYVISEDIPYENQELDTGDSLILDFGDHYTGYLSLSLGYRGYHPDAPVWLRISFAENPREFFQKAEDYHGWICAGWIQAEQVHVDVLPGTLSLSRRYAFRYVKIEALAISGKFHLKVTRAVAEAVSSADESRLLPYPTQDTRAALLDRIAVRTLHECMQQVFEDGPKRDHRLWLGDLHLEALANYETYRQNDLVKRCLYLFAANPLPDGQIANNLFLDPVVEADDNRMFDYSLLYIPTLLEYVRQTDDREALRDLYPAAIRQLELARALFDENGILGDTSSMGDPFLDWNMTLDKQAGGQGVYLYCLEAAADLAVLAQDGGLAQELRKEHEAKAAAARKYLWDKKKQVFVSGPNRQISYASQCWLILADAVDVEEGALILDRVRSLEKQYKAVHVGEKKMSMADFDFFRTDFGQAIAVLKKDADAHPDRIEGMVTPYMYHTYVDALLHVGRRDEARAVLLDYWGGMADQGADTFWEMYNPENPDESPYGGTIVNSYCHAWSCAPAYFLRKYYRQDKPDVQIN